MRKSPCTSSPPHQQDVGDEDLYFEMEFPVHGAAARLHSSSRLSMESYGSQSTGLDSSRESPCRDSRESSAGRSDHPTRGTPRRERPNSLIIPVKSRLAPVELFGSLPRPNMGRVPKISLPNYSVPNTPRAPRGSWEERDCLRHSNLSGILARASIDMNSSHSPFI